MKNKISALLLSLLAARAFAAAPVEIRAFTEMPSAPTALAPGALAAPALTPTLASPISAAPALLSPAAIVPAAAPALAAPALSAAPAAAMPAVAAAAPAAAAISPAPSALSVLPAAAIGDRKGPPAGGESSARAAGVPFDGSRVPTDAELADLYRAARPGSETVAVLERQGGFASAAGQLVSQYTFINEHLLEGLRASNASLHPEGRRVIKAVEELTTLVDSHDDPAARRFLQALGVRQAAEFHEQQKVEALFRGFLFRRSAGPERRHMPRNDLGSGDYWDIAAGMNAGGFILRELEPGTRYSFFDLSPFVISYLNAIAARHGADAAAIEADVMKLQKPERPLAVLRTKNAVAYVPGFEKKLTEMVDWIAPGGRLVIQNDPMPGQRELIVGKHGPLARRLIEEGWDFSFEFTSSRDAVHALDTLIFVRPRTEGIRLSPQETRVRWERYLAAVNHADARSGY